MVELFSTPMCTTCKNIKAYFVEKDIKYRDYNVLSDKQRLKEMKERTGKLSVPTLIINGTVLSGFNKKVIDKLTGV